MRRLVVAAATGMLVLTGCNDSEPAKPAQTVPPPVVAATTTPPPTTPPTTTTVIAVPTSAGVPAVTVVVPRVPAPVTAAPARRTAAPVPAAAVPPPTSTRRTTSAPAPEPVVEEEPERPAASYKNCSEVRAAGAAPIRRGDPGFRDKFDADGDGVGCE